MRVVVTGSSGLIGSALISALSGEHTLTRLVRRTPRAAEARWDPDAGTLAPGALDGADAVVHLAGESVASGRWNAARKARIRDSRVKGTALLARAISALSPGPKVFISTSAVGYYGSRGDEVLDERSAPGHGFLADLTREWEAATRPAADAGTRVVTIRLGVVLSSRGGALATMLPSFRLGAGAAMGAGTQYMSWIAIDDVVGAIRHLLLTDAVAGPANLVAPEPVTNADFTRTLGRVLRRPTLLRVPASALRILLGEMADEMLLASTRVRPSRLLDSGYRFRHPALEGALRHVLGRP